ncbi:ExbD/TolR family protein [Lacimonas salitolerans]|uniref:ExbD/TolR family protein n=1 Tax=Lacimonas salitolerans TaxID=1323750 RepID=A0ABW4ED01_9RHOB
MRFAPPVRRTPRETIVPMINVVFLLLIFFLMTAQIAPPDPFDMDLPQASEQADLDGPAVLWLAADGTPALDGVTGEAVWSALAALGPDVALSIRADQALPGVELARVMQRLSGLGLRDVQLAVQP